MTLKNSFLTDVMENLKRRNWVFWISFLTFFCYFPGYLILALSNLKASYGEIATAEALLRIQGRMNAVVKSNLQLNGVMPVIIIFLAILIGMQGFAYLHNKRQVDFYHSQPVSRKRRFLVLWLNGILTFVVTYLVNMVLGMVVAAIYGQLSTVVICGALEGALLYLVFFLGIYHIALIAVLLCGNALVSILAMGVLLGYEIGCRAMSTFLADQFFLTYGNNEVEKMFDTWLSPIVIIYKHYYAANEGSYYAQDYTYMKAFTGLLVLAVIFGIISFVLYQKRASESHGNSISFDRIKEPVRFLVLLLIGSFGSYMIYIVTGESIPLTILGAVFFVGLGHAVIQLIYEVDFGAIRKKWITAVISLVSVILIFLSFKYDWTGYDYRIPKKSKVESVMVSLIADNFCDSVHVMPDGKEIHSYAYKKNNMKLTDLDTIYELLENRELIKQTEYQHVPATAQEYIEIIFRLKNGKTESRNIYVNYEENMGIIDKIYHMEEFQKVNNQVMEDNFVEDYKIVSAEYVNGIEKFEVPSHQVKALVAAYQKDVEQGKYAEVYYNMPIGKLEVKGIGLQDPEFRNRWDVLIYESYKNTIDILKQSGIEYEAVFDEDYINQITKIEIQYTEHEKLSEGYTWQEANKTLIYTDKEMFDKLLENAVPADNRWWGKNRNSSEDYYMYVFKPHLYDENYYEEIYFQPGEIPQFLIEELEKIPFGEEVMVK